MMARRADDETIDVAVTIAAPPDEIWLAIVDEASRAGWWAHLDLDAKSGGRFEELWHDADGQLVRTHGRVIEFVPNRCLRLSWSDEDWTETTEVEIRLEPLGDATRVRVRHSGWGRVAAGAALVDEHRTGWRTHLRNLRRHLEHSV